MKIKKHDIFVKFLAASGLGDIGISATQKKNKHLKLTHPATKKEVQHLVDLWEIFCQL